MAVDASNRWRQVAWFATVVVAVLVFWRLLGRLIQAVRNRRVTRRSR